LKDGNKNDRIDARKLAELLRTNQLKPVYHGEHGVRTLKELGRSYLTITKDVTRVIPYDSWNLYKSYWTRQIVENGKQLSQAVKKIECRIDCVLTHSAFGPYPFYVREEGLL
jgi:hypothetical protein